MASSIPVSGNDGDERLRRAAEQGDLEGVEAALAEGADLASADSTFGNTALHLAARRGHFDIVELLLAKGADPLANDASIGSSRVQRGNPGNRPLASREPALKGPLGEFFDGRPREIRPPRAPPPAWPALFFGIWAHSPFLAAP